MASANEIKVPIHPPPENRKKIKIIFAFIMLHVSLKFLPPNQCYSTLTNLQLPFLSVLYLTKSFRRFIIYLKISRCLHTRAPTT